MNEGSYQAIEVETETLDNGRSVVSFILRRPEARNAFNNRMAGEIHDAARAVAERTDVAVVLVRAHGPVFCAGADVKERKTLSEDDIRARRLRGFRAYDAIETLPMPVVCVIDGPCIGSGCEIALACDFIIASTRASFRIPEARLGTIGATQRLSRAIGLRRAKEMMFTGRPIDAGQALQWGLVNRIVDQSALADDVRRLARDIAEAPTAAMRLAKKTMNRGHDDSRHGALAHEIMAIEDNLDSGEWRAGMLGGRDA